MRNFRLRRRYPVAIGHSNYFLVSEEAQLSYEIDYRLNSNLPRYRRQGKVLVNRGHFECAAKGMIIKYVLKWNRLNVEVSENGVDKRINSFERNLPILGKGRRKALHREMARTEIDVWPRGDD